MTTQKITVVTNGTPDVDSLVEYNFLTAILLYIKQLRQTQPTDVSVKGR